MDKEKQSRTGKLLRKWVITISGFVVMMIVFVLIDGTFLEPNNNIVGDFATRIVDSEFFVSYLTFFENPFFNIITVLAILHIIFHGIKDGILVSKMKKSGN